MKKAFVSQQLKTAVITHYENFLEGLSVPSETINFSTQYGNTFALISGNRNSEPVILLHGSSMNSAMWLDDIALLSRYYRVIALDIPGEPGKSDERQLSFNNDEFTHWLKEAFSFFKIKKAILVGNSLGGWIALKFAIAHPEYIKKLVLLAPAGIGSQNPEFAIKAMQLIPKGDAGLTELFTEINGGITIPKARLEYQKLIAAAFNARKEVLPLFSDEELKRLSMPCMILLGQKDIMIKSQETMERAMRLISHCSIKQYPQNGHSLVGMEYEILHFLQSEQETEDRQEVIE